MNPLVPYHKPNTHVDDKLPLCTNKKRTVSLSLTSYQQDHDVGPIKTSAFKLLIKGEEYISVDKDSGCSNVANDEFVKFDNVDFHIKNSDLEGRISEVFSKGFSQICDFIDPNGKPACGSCHDFSHYLIFGIKEGLSTFYENEILRKVPIDVKFLPYDGNFRVGDILQLCESDGLDRHTALFHSAVYLGNGKLIHKMGGENIYIQNLESLLKIKPPFIEKLYCRIMRMNST